MSYFPPYSYSKDKVEVDQLDIDKLAGLDASDLSKLSDIANNNVVTKCF